MALNNLKIKDLRNLGSISLELNSGFNLFYGANGSGKTSLLEAIYMLGHGRSFRGRYVSRIIRDQQQKLSVYAKLLGQGGSLLPVGIERTLDGKNRIKVANESVSMAAELAKLLPIKLINPDSYQLLDAGPKYRRQFIDWGLFHVEHSFFSLWKEAQRILKQRNSALRSGLPRSQVALWDAKLVTATNSMDSLRSIASESLIQKTMLLLQGMLDISGLKIDYYPGWPKKHEFAEVLQQSFSRDAEKGYSHYGPHRADLKITVRNQPASSVLSRGQQKVLVNSLHLAQGMLLKEQTNKNSIYLIDDLPAELDLAHRKALVGLLSQLNTQVFVTGVELRDLEELFDGYSTKMFHVERGSIKEFTANICVTS